MSLPVVFWGDVFIVVGTIVVWEVVVRRMIPWAYNWIVDQLAKI